MPVVGRRGRLLRLAKLAATAPSLGAGLPFEPPADMEERGEAEAYALDRCLSGATHAAALPAYAQDKLAMHDHEREHTHVQTDDARRLTLALALILGLMVAEVVAGILADSLALLSDAGHMLTDAGAIALALFAAQLARRPAEGVFTFGFRRAEILSAQLNGATLVALAVVIVVEGSRRLVHPPDVEGAVVLAVALAGIVVNLAATLVLSGAERRSLNVEGAFQHVLTDLFAFVATAVAGAVVLATGFSRAD